MDINKEYLKYQITGITHKFLVKNLQIQSDKIYILIGVDDEEVTFIVEKGPIGYMFPGGLINLSNEKFKRTRHFIELVDNFYNGLPVSLPIDMTYFDE
jgi:hypothetical protein